jgi:hypothetical protein
LARARAEESLAVDEFVGVAVYKVRGNRVTTVTGDPTGPTRIVVPVLAPVAYFDSKSTVYTLCMRVVHNLANKIWG